MTMMGSGLRERRALGISEALALAESDLDAAQSKAASRAGTEEGAALRLGVLQAGQSLFVTERTVETHLGRALRKLDVSSRCKLPDI